MWIYSVLTSEVDCGCLSVFSWKILCASYASPRGINDRLRLRFVVLYHAFQVTACIVIPVLINICSGVGNFHHNYRGEHSADTKWVNSFLTECTRKKRIDIYLLTVAQLRCAWHIQETCSPGVLKLNPVTSNGVGHVSATCLVFIALIYEWLINLIVSDRGPVRT